MQRHCLKVWLLVVNLLYVSTTSAQTIYPGKTGSELETLLRGEFSPSNVLSYNEAKKVMFTKVDNQNNRVRLIYTGDFIETNTVPSHTFVNAEHVWPQSKFGNDSIGKRSDLHHIFPAYTIVNSTRGNRPFTEIPDNETKKWWNGPTFLSGIPGSQIDTYSESNNQFFEPREADKGNVARAMFYFRTVYGNKGIDLPFFEKQKKVLLNWHTKDPADTDEIARNARVAQTQGNRNPFIDDVTLAQRVFNPLAVPKKNPNGNPKNDLPTNGNTQSIQDGDEIDVMTWNLRFFFDADRSDNQSDLAKEESADSVEEFESRVKDIVQVIHKAGLPEIIALQEVENQKVVERLAKELNTTHQAKYKVGFIQGTDTFTEQDVAYLYADKGITVSFARIPNSDFNNPTLFNVPSKHTVMTVTHTLADGQTKRLILVNCHLKAGSGSSNETQRKKQARVINSFINKSLMTDPTQGIIVLGDMNASKPFANTSTQDAMGVMRGMETASALDDLVDVNEELPPNKRITHASNRELDRILLSGALLDNKGLVFRQVVVRRDLILQESDHFPMIATFIYRVNPGP